MDYTDILEVKDVDTVEWWFDTSKNFLLHYSCYSGYIARWTEATAAYFAKFRRKENAKGPEKVRLHYPYYNGFIASSQDSRASVGTLGATSCCITHVIAGLLRGGNQAKGD